MVDYHITAKMGGLKRKYKYSRDKLIKKLIRCRSYKNFVVHTFLIDFFYVMKYDECVDETNEIPYEVIC